MFYEFKIINLERCLYTSLDCQREWREIKKLRSLVLNTTPAKGAPTGREPVREYLATELFLPWSFAQVPYSLNPPEARLKGDFWYIHRDHAARTGNQVEESERWIWNGRWKIPRGFLFLSVLYYTTKYFIPLSQQQYFNHFSSVLLRRQFWALTRIPAFFIYYLA